jgi:cell division protein FtsI/penicillin-binding protein 2
VQHSFQLSNRRLAIVSLGFVLIASFLGLRLVQKTVLEHASYTAIAQSQQFERKEVTGKRGQILIKDGQGKATYPLATNQTTYSLTVVPSQVSDKHATSEKLADVSGLSQDFIFEQINNTKQYIPPLKRKMTFDEAEEVRKQKLEGVAVESEESRFYPEDSMAAQVLGFVNNDGQGQYGVESYYNDLLTPKNGSTGETKDAEGNVVALGATTYDAPQDGDTVVLTIDRNIQYQAEQALQKAVEKFSATGGSVVVMDPKTGAIKAMASRPNFDPNRFSAYGAEGFINPVISGTYEPGSTFKPIIMASALDAGAVTPTTTVNGTASVHVGDRDIFNSEKRPYGVETMTQVIERSDNVGMVFVQRQMGGQKMYDYIQRYGFGTPTGIELSGEVSPGITPIEQLYDVNFATMSFGQGIAVTPIQLLAATGVFANQGKLMSPHLVEQIQHQDGKVETVEPKTIRQVISPQASSQIGGMMVRVVEAGAGKPAQVSGYRVAGKTGTAQIPNGTGGYEEGTTIGNFVGFAPVEDPRFVMLVKIDRPKGVTYAEESAAPTFGELAKYLLTYYNVPPSK